MKVCVTQMCCACDEGRSKKKECKYGEDLSSLIPIDPDYPGYAAVKLLLKDVTFDAACRLAPILLKGPDFEREDCPVESTTTVRAEPHEADFFFFKRPAGLPCLDGLNAVFPRVP